MAFWTYLIERRHSAGSSSPKSGRLSGSVSANGTRLTVPYRRGRSVSETLDPSMLEDVQEELTYGRPNDDGSPDTGGSCSPGSSCSADTHHLHRRTARTRSADYSSGTKTRYIPGTHHLLLADVEEEKKKRHKSAPFSPFGTSPARRELLPNKEGEIDRLKAKNGASQSFEQIFSVSRNVPTKRVYSSLFFIYISIMIRNIKEKANVAESGSNDSTDGFTPRCPSTVCRDSILLRAYLFSLPGSFHMGVGCSCHLVITHAFKYFFFRCYLFIHVALVTCPLFFKLIEP